MNQLRIETVSQTVPIRISAQARRRTPGAGPCSSRARARSVRKSARFFGVRLREEVEDVADDRDDPDAQSRPSC